MGRLSTHVLDTVNGRPAPGVAITLDRLLPDGSRRRLVETRTNADGRTDAPLLSGDGLTTGTYELSFAIGAYFRALGAPCPSQPSSTSCRCALASPTRKAIITSRSWPRPGAIQPIAAADP